MYQILVVGVQETNCIGDYIIKVLDLVEHITGAADERRYYFEQDGHFNATGNTRVAELIYEHWLEPAREHAA